MGSECRRRSSEAEDRKGGREVECERGERERHVAESPTVCGFSLAEYVLEWLPGNSLANSKKHEMDTWEGKEA